MPFCFVHGSLRLARCGREYYPRCFCVIVRSMDTACIFPHSERNLGGCPAPVGFRRAGCEIDEIGNFPAVVYAADDV